MEMANDVIEDVQDGEIWKEFAKSNYFDSKYNLALMLNVDWFRPFKRSNYKVAAIMLTVCFFVVFFCTKLVRKKKQKKNCPELAQRIEIKEEVDNYMWYVAMSMHHIHAAIFIFLLLLHHFRNHTWPT